MTIRALFLNCTLKASSGSKSSTQALIDKLAQEFEKLKVETESIRIVDHNVRFGAAMDEGDGDEWPVILDRIRAADILIMACPIWIGERSSVAKMVAERLDATTYQLDSRNQHEMYGKVGGAIALGESDGGQAAIKSMLYDLSIAGFTVPPNAEVQGDLTTNDRVITRHVGTITDGTPVAAESRAIGTPTAAH